MIGGTDPNDGAALSEAVAAINTALNSLKRLGQSDKADAIVTAAEQSNPYAGLDADTEHSESWLRSAYALKYTTVMTDLARRLTTAAASAGTGDQDDAARVYGIKGLDGDVASLAISRRDAGDRVENSDPAHLRTLLATAIRNGDEVLAHAIAENAIKRGDADTTTDFGDAYPKLTAAVERLWTAENRDLSSTDLTVAWRVAALKPPPLGSMQNYDIAALASAHPTGSSSR